MIYSLTKICFDYQYHGYTGIYDKMHGLTREVDNSFWDSDTDCFIMLRYRSFQLPEMWRQSTA